MITEPISTWPHSIRWPAAYGVNAETSLVPGGMIAQRTHAAFGSWSAGAGAYGSLSMVPPLLAPGYGGRVAPGFGLFLNVSPRAAVP